MCEILTAQQLADRFQVAPDTIKTWAREGIIPSIRVTQKVIRYNPTEVYRVLQQRNARVSPATIPQASET